MRPREGRRLISYSNRHGASWACSVLFFCALFSGAAQAVSADPEKILAESDLSRGGGYAGLAWDVNVNSIGAKDVEDEQTLLHVMVADQSSLAEISEPLRNKGFRILQVGRNMWIGKPGMRKPVAISPRQRLSGQAALGDIAATAYARDYAATALREESVAGEPCFVLDLSASRPNTTYDRITYWVSERSGLAVKAQFLSVSGKPLKNAEFTYENRVTVNGRSIPFISKMTIRDALTADSTTLTFSGIRIKDIPVSVFQINNLQ
ncbi:outer membrane lipoprotein-sorting protein [Paraburkholderia sp. J69-2]|uniref:outer membrane lipoprotein-sorting protein n=1 Tax=Paraburkholderia sp. J69-2 TaxID=2805437 RepID=UPI002AB28356|nr:outer membrane lipoprotein-sorting protein [Paraburkholderia sp. J69-2]